MSLTESFIPSRGAHAVQFYESDDYLCTLVANFVAEGVRAGDPVIVIATREHCDAFAAKLDDHDLSGVTFIDAREALACFMVGRMPDANRFRTYIGDALAAASGEQHLTVRAYGEMVDLLWRDGNAAAALRLEELWNALHHEQPFALLCAYPIANFYKEGDASLFDEMCGSHSHVIPAETLPAEIDSRLRMISSLQQRAVQLEAEMDRRKELERELQDFVERANVPMHWVGPDGTILWANEAELSLLGYTREEYIGRSIVDFHADRAVIDDILSRLLANEEIRDREARLRAKDGTIRWVSINSTALFRDGVFVHTRCFSRDITDRKRFEEAERAAAEANALLLDFTMTLHQSLEVTTRLEEAGALLVPRIADGWAVDIRNEHGAIERIASAGTIEAPACIARDASLSPMRIVAPLMLNEQLLGAVTFVSLRPRFTANDLRLACDVAQRTAIAIENARLYRLAQDSNRTKDEFLATLSHELRTPLTAILGWAKMLSLGGLDAETTRVAYATIERSARTQAMLIDDLLDLSKVVTGKLKLETELVDLGSVIDNAVATLKLASEAKGITIDVNRTPDRVVVAGDATRLQQIAWNLLSNAVKFSEAGSSVSVALERIGERARLFVRDRGRGIAPEFLPHVFEAFRQADGASTRTHGGLGLGLAIVKYLTEAHGGSVVATSDGEGTGATFTVTLPIALPRSTEAAATLREEVVDLTGLSIVLVDDDDDTRNVVAAALRRCGAMVEATESARGARNILETVRPDFVVTDIAMPLEDGMSLIQDLASRPNPLPIVALSALAPPEEGNGYRAWIRKPIDPLEFARVIADLR
jgi:PAS domain S-box-containing protein